MRARVQHRVYSALSLDFIISQNAMRTFVYALQLLSQCSCRHFRSHRNGHRDKLSGQVTGTVISVAKKKETKVVAAASSI